MRNNTGFRSSQQGAVLVIALIVMVMVSLLGISAMRASVQSNKVATGVQADTMSFEAAETALGMAFNTLNSMSEEELTAAVIDGSSVEYCITEDGITDSDCDNNEFMDSRELLKAQAFASHPPNNCRPISGFDVEEFKDLVINLLGESEMPNYNIQNHHLQEGLKLGRNCI